MQTSGERWYRANWTGPEAGKRKLSIFADGQKRTGEVWTCKPFSSWGCGFEGVENVSTCLYVWRKEYFKFFRFGGFFPPKACFLVKNDNYYNFLSQWFCKRSLHRSKSCRNIRMHGSKYECMSIWWLSGLTWGVSPHQIVCGTWVLRGHYDVLLYLAQGVNLVIKQMHPKSQETDKNGRTVSRCSH